MTLIRTTVDTGEYLFRRYRSISDLGADSAEVGFMVEAFTGEVSTAEATTSEPAGRPE